MKLRSALLLTLATWMLIPAMPASLHAQSPGTPAAETAQDQLPAMLVADQVFITPERQLVAEGNVEAFQGTTRLSARKITFDRASGKLEIEGPIRIDQDGRMTILAEAADLDQGLQNGLLKGARLVFDQQVQLASLQMVRVGGRYTQLYKTSVTSCHVCENGKPPLWQIRARSVTHDQLERQLYFEGAQLRVLDVPVFYFPALRLPDPTLDRASGFLKPSIRTTSQLGTGIKVPYFFRIGDSRDLTVTPYVSPHTKTMDLRYRQAFRHGGIEIKGAYTRDDLTDDDSRGYLFATGGFDLGNRYKLSFDLKTVADDAYLVDYGLPDYDRLRSEIELTRTTRDSAFRGALIHYDSLRDSEIEDEIPTRIADVSYEHRLFPTRLGGEFRLSLNSRAYERTSSANIVGRDVTRATADAEWRRHWITASGLRADWEMGFSADIFKISNDSTYGNHVTRSTPRAALSLRYPMTMTTGTGVTHFLEPVVQLGWSDVHGGTPPIDESRFVEFDQGNLLALSRFPSEDAREDGTALAIGVNWARFAPSGWQVSASAGQVFRSVADPDFSISSGLAGKDSDLLLAAQIKNASGIAFTARGLLNDSFSFSKVELRSDWSHRRTTLSGSYLWLGIDPQESRMAEVSEFWVDGSYKVNPSWTATANLRYDIASDNATYAGVGLIYRNECVTVDLSLNRRYTSSTSVEPSTNFGFTIALSGFAVESGTEKYRRSCGKS
ncbi:LPS-assembly protein LptD [Pseudodonghicola xiamenensis]|uniref:LPS-assembly protein LptD n=1 Tax=Pseudodonghicola xiamenensis TaxID=337702 RepID=A0A8J3MBQ6_9RHOB|nr:LPS assembly protein LptD [Pseudodonghicola xiamenensis]GHG80250.1 LPS-assembly protein LptD [Pseudodonghicola xiamenensis]